MLSEIFVTVHLFFWLCGAVGLGGGPMGGTLALKCKDPDKGESVCCRG